MKRSPIRPVRSGSRERKEGKTIHSQLSIVNYQLSIVNFVPRAERSAALPGGALFRFFPYRMPFRMPLPSLRAERSLRATVPMPKRRQSWTRSWMELSS